MFFRGEVRAVERGEVEYWEERGGKGNVWGRILGRGREGGEVEYWEGESSEGRWNCEKGER